MKENGKTTQPVNTGAANIGNGVPALALNEAAGGKYTPDGKTPGGGKSGERSDRAKNRSARGREKAGIAAGYVVLSLLSVLWLLPIAYLIYTAFRVTPDTGIINKLFPDNLALGFGNFRRLFKETAFAVWLKNTLIVSSCSCALTTLFILMVSYALSRLRFRLRKPIMNVLLILGMFPGFMSMIAVYFILKAMGLTNSLFALILVYSGSPGLS